MTTLPEKPEITPISPQQPQFSKKGIAIIVGFILIVLLAVGVILTTRKPETSQTPAPTPSAGPITINGKFVCLPHKGTGLHTMECIFGLMGDDDQYYALHNSTSDTSNWNFDVQVTVKGTFRPETSKA